MSDPFVVAHMFQPARPITLRRLRGHQIGGAAGGVPAVLVIPRGGPSPAPRLVVVRGSDESLPIPLYDLAGGDAHIVADIDDVQDRSVRALADVLMTRPARQPSAAAARVTGALDRYLGCGIAVTRDGQGGFLMGLRDGRLAEITGVGRFAADCDPWPGVFGSFLYAWIAANLPLSMLGSALLIAGHYAVDREGGSELRVAGRVTVAVRPNVWTPTVQAAEPDDAEADAVVRVAS
ncbi:hypothetical protein J5X84_44060 [Streptosporangiaceae bacterium NEAU-GS5]|nr:hypothetical protein [Streptosporangiaceae bacterium NEAU-GS5]